MRVYLTLFIGVLINTHGISQVNEKEDINLERLIDEIFPVQDEDFNYEELYEIYAQRLLNPLNLNKSSDEQLRSLSILSDLQLNEFIKYRNENGPILSIYELQVIPSFTEPIIRLLKPFVSIEDAGATGWKNLLHRVWNEENNYFVSRIEQTLEEKAGYTESASPSNRYFGSSTKIYNRFRVSSSGDFSFGITTEKDAGEQMEWSPSTNQYAFDFLSVHAQVQNKGFLHNLIIGDYQAQFGQGLTLGGGFGMGKGSETITAMRRSNVGFIPYTSAAEYGFMRGVSASAALTKSLIFHAFYSNSTRDGNSQSESNSDIDSVSSLILTGMHRTVKEIESRRNISEFNYGGVIQYKKSEMDAGLIIHRISFSSPIIRNPSLYNQFVFNGSRNTNIGFYWNHSVGNFALFTEVSHSFNNGTAATLGLLASISPKMDLSLLYRRFDKNYYTFYSNAVAENSTPQNEEGVYCGWKYRLSKTHSASGYIDIFRFPWLRFRSYKPSDGSEWMFRYNFTPTKQVQLFAQLRQEKKLRNLGEDTPQYSTAMGTKTNYWINADYKISPNIGFKTRVQFISYDIGSNFSSGISIIQDVNYRIQRFTFNARIALFDTDNYDTRLYVYESDAWLAFSIPAFQGVGLREYILVQYKISKKIDIWVRWAKTEYENQYTIGSGGELINGNQKNDFKVQIRIKL